MVDESNGAFRLILLFALLLALLLALGIMPLTR